MAATTVQPPRDRKIYGFIFILGALIQFIPLTMDILNTPGHYSQLPGTIGLIVLFAIILLTYIVVGCFALRARTPETVFVLRLTTIIGLLYGSALGILMAFFASGPHEAGLGVFLMTVMPLLVLQSLASGSGPGILLVLVPHIFALLGMGIGGFLIAKRTSSIKHGVWWAFLIALTTTLFVLYSGVIYTLIFPSPYLPLSNYTNTMTLFLAPLVPLLLYALVSGTVGASLSGSERPRSMENS